MEKVILTKEQIVAIEDVRKFKNDSEILTLHKKEDEGWAQEWEPLNGIEYQKLEQALINGYQTKEDYVQELEKDADKRGHDTDNVNKPSHYTTGKIEVIDYIKDKLTPEQYVGYCMGNVIKYTSRWQHKGGLQDLEKAEVYLKWAIKAAKENE